MRAVIICGGLNPALRELDEHTPAALMVLGDRPLLQHVVEYFAGQAVREFDFILHHLPEQIESYLGDGARWGCQFRYHLVAHEDQAWKTLRLICEGLNEEISLAHAERFPADNWSVTSSTPTALVSAEAGGTRWSGWAVFHSSMARQLFAYDTCQAVDERLHAAIDAGTMESRLVDLWVSVDSPDHILASQRILLDGRASTIQLTGTQGEKGAWTGRNSSIHPTAVLNPPFFLGANARIGERAQIGPYAIVGENCIIDDESVVENSMVAPGTYAGQGLELRDVILDRNRLVNSRLDASYLISDAFVAGNLLSVGMSGQLRQCANRLLALILLILFSPVTFAVWIGSLLDPRLRVRSTLYVTTPASAAPSEWRTARRFRVEIENERQAGGSMWKHFACEFLPGLFSVLGGSLRICGIPPRSPEQWRELPSDWRAICLQCAPGLVSEDLVACGPGAAAEELYSAESYYFAVKSFTYDLTLLARYFERLIVGTRDPVLGPAAEGHK